MAHKWGRNTIASNVVSTAHSRAMGGTSPAIDNMVIESISIRLNGTGSHRLAVYTGGSLDNPSAATLLWDAGEVTPSGNAWYTITHPSGGISLPKNTIVWLAWKRNGSSTTVVFDSDIDDTDKFQTGRGRDTNAFNQDPSVAFPSTYGGTPSFGNARYSIYITYSISSVPPIGYAIELRDKDFNLKARLEPFVTGLLSWEWDKIGGCGRCLMKVSGDYLRFNISADDDIRIYIPNEDGISATLRYRGYVQQPTPSIVGGEQVILLEIVGYSRWFKRLIINESEGVKIYTNTEISLVVNDVLDNFITGNSSITKGTIDPSNFVPDKLTFKTNAREVLRTCFDLIGDVEYGVDANLVFFWRTQNTNITHKYWVGDKVSKLSNKVDFNGIANVIFFEGGKVNGSTFKLKRSSPTSISRYGKHEVILSNSSITTNTVANQYITGQFRLRGKPILQSNVELKSINKQFEATQPIGAVSIVDPDATQTSAIYGTTGNGGSNKLYGTISNDGSGQFYGGAKREQIDRIIYTLNTRNGFIDAQIQFGNSLNFSRASASIRRIQLNQDALRQRSL